MLMSSSKAFPACFFAIVCTINTSTYGMTPYCKQIGDTPSAQSDSTKGIRFAWNKTLFTAEEYHQTYCRQSCCHSGKFAGCMLSCSCQSHRPACEIYNSCCPDVSTPSPNITWEYGDVFPRGNQKEGARVRWKETVAEKEHPKLECFQTDEFSFLHIRSCPPEYSVNRSVADLCERDMSLDQLTLDTYILYVDMETEVFYRNKFCALCNDVLRAIPIDTSLSCNSHMFVYKATNFDELLRFHLMDKVNCDVTFTLPENLEPFTCYQEQFGENVISTCEQAPRVEDIDQDIVMACNELTAAKYRVWHTSALKFYRNIFCAICDMKSYPILIQDFACFSLPFHRRLPPLSLIRLSFRGEFLISRHPASASDEYINLGSRYQNTSLQLKCAQGKIIENKTCAAIFPDIRGLQYSLRMWLLPFGLSPKNQLDSPAMTKLVKSVKAKIHSIMDSLTSHYVVTVSGVCVQGKRTAIYLKSCSFWTDSKFVGDVPLPRSVFEDRITTELIKNAITVNVSENVTVDLQSLVAIGEFVFDSYCNGNSSRTDIKCFKDDDQEVTEDLTPAVRFLDEVINLSATLTCSFVSFNRSRYHIYMRENLFHTNVQSVELMIPPKVVVKIRFRDRDTKQDVLFSEIPELNLLRKDEQGSLNVCTELIARKFNIQI